MLDLSPIKARLAAVGDDPLHRGPWRASDRWATDVFGGVAGGSSILYAYRDPEIKKHLGSFVSADVRDFVAHSLEDVERLIAEVERLKAAIYSGGECPREQAEQIDPVAFLKTRWVPVKEANDV